MSDTSRILNPTTPGGLLSPNMAGTMTPTELLNVQKIGADTFFYTNDVLIGTPNGVLKVFNTHYTIKPLGSEEIKINGIIQFGGGNDYTVSGTTTITFVDAPRTGDILLASYRSEA